MTFVTAHEQAVLPAHTDERLPRGVGLMIGAAVSLVLWAPLIYGAIRLFG